LLPSRRNDGSAIPEERIATTLIELEERFGAVSCETQTTRGRWRHDGVSYKDDLVRVYVDVPDAIQHRAFFESFKDTLKDRFEQLDIWMTTYPIEVL
jgi:hypothetical protein